MATRSTSTKGKSGGATVDAMEQQVAAFAKHVGRVAGTLQVKAEGLMDRAALRTHLARLRDGATHLLEQLAGEASKPKPRTPAAKVRRTTGARSGGAVDAPGKRHRKPLPSDPGANLADSQAAKMRAATPMAKTNKLRGRG